MALDGIGSGTPASGATAAPIDQRAALPQLAAEIATLRRSDPAQAATLQRQSEAAMTPVERGQLAAAIDAKVADTGWRGSFDRAMAAPRAAAAFQSGLREGLFEGAKSFVVDTATLVGKTVQFGADQMPGGWLGDKLRDATGGLPGVLDAVIPSNARGDATAASLRSTAGAIRDYAISRAQDPSKLLADTEGFIQKNWDSLKGSHAEAAARGPEAEAKWWGQTMGRVAFEIGSNFIPVAGQANKVAQGARAVDKIGDVANTVDNVGDAARAAGRTGDVRPGAGAANDAARLADPLPARASRDAFDDLPDISGDGVGAKPTGGAWKNAPNWDNWIKAGGKVIADADGSVTYIRSDLAQVRYNPQGRPDFSPHMTHPSGVRSVEIAQTGRNPTDFAAANKEAGHPEWGNESPDGYTWHHHENRTSMQLVDSSVHNGNMALGLPKFSHAGGASASRAVE